MPRKIWLGRRKQLDVEVMAGVRPAGERLVLLPFVDSAAFCLDHQEHTLLGHQTDTGKFPLVQGKALNSANFTAVTGYAV